MKKFLILLLTAIAIGGCNYNSIQKKIYSEYFKKGYISKDYTFSDSGIRNLSLTFLNDSTLELSNRVTKEHRHSYYKWNFDVQYKYFSPKVGIIVIQESRSDNNYLSNEGYVKPFRKEGFSTMKSVFPDIKKDTIFFSQNFMKVQIREFTFNIEDK